jgi:hypothetical protein
LLPSVAAPVDATINALTLAVELTIDRFAFAIKATIYAITITIEFLSAYRTTVFFGAIRATIEFAIDTITLAIEALLDAVTLVVEVLLDTVALVVSECAARGQKKSCNTYSNRRLIHDSSPFTQTNSVCSVQITGGHGFG